MPSAGAVAPPAIIPLREHVPGRPMNHIGTSTYIELDSGEIVKAKFTIHASMQYTSTAHRLV